MTRMFIDGFNKLRNKIATSYLNFEDDSMGDICFRNAVKGDLPQLYCIICKS